MNLSLVFFYNFITKTLNLPHYLDFYSSLALDSKILYKKIACYMLRKAAHLISTFNNKILVRLLQKSLTFFTYLGHFAAYCIYNVQISI